jgi:predicted TIM-barrel fold metal-dependent hydrolase
MADIIDAHHHIWRQNDLPWLAGPMLPRIFGPYDVRRRDYPVAEFLADLEGSGVTKSVYVQANWAPERFEDETAWVQKTNEETGWPHAIVGFADMMGGDVRPQLDRLSKYPLLRGIRQQIHWHENEVYRFAPHGSVAADATFRHNITCLSDYGLSFDLQVFASQMQGAAALAEACPDVTFILQHSGMLEDLSDAGREEWRTGMELLAAQKNVVSKLSAFGTFIHKNDPDHIADMVTQTVDMFGAARCLFGSNFPIEKLWCDYGALIAAFRAAAEILPEAVAQAIFHDTAAAVYRI